MFRQILDINNSIDFFVLFFADYPSHVVCWALVWHVISGMRHIVDTLYFTIWCEGRKEPQDSRSLVMSAFIKCTNKTQSPQTAGEIGAAVSIEG